MNLIICVDVHNGLAFNNRRQSRDKKVIDKIIEIASPGKLWVSSYSEELFEDQSMLNVSESICQDARDDDFIFAEVTAIPQSIMIDTLYVFNWNRRYPADTFFELDLSQFKLVATEEFTGNSHDKITLSKFERLA